MSRAYLINPSEYKGSPTSAEIKPSAVILPSISDQQEDPNLEPQKVQVRSPNTASVYLDSTKCIDYSNGTYRISTAQTINQIGTPLIKGVRRIAFKRLNITYDLANIFTGNNILTFKVFITAGVEHILSIDLLLSPLPYYPYNATTYATLLQTEMNASIVANLPPGYPTVTVTPVTSPSHDYVSFELGDGINKFIAIDSTCNFITGHSSTMNLYANDYTTVTNSTLPLLFIYDYAVDPYIDIASNALTQNSKLRSTTNSYLSNSIIHRIENVRIGRWSYTELQLNWINVNSDTQIYTIDLTFIDEFGQPITRIDSRFFRWNIELIMEK